MRLPGASSAGQASAEGNSGAAASCSSPVATETETGTAGMVTEAGMAAADRPTTALVQIHRCLPRWRLNLPRSIANFPWSIGSSPQSIANFPWSIGSSRRGKLNPDWAIVNPRRGKLNLHWAIVDPDQCRFDLQRARFEIQVRGLPHPGINPMLFHTSRSGLGGSGLLPPLRGWERRLALFLGLTPQALRWRPFGAEFIAGRLSGWIPFHIVGCWGATSRASPEGAT
jgi:hypothetical protein